MAGENGSITIEGYGTRRLNIIQVGHGMSIVASGDQTKHGQSFYAVKRTSGSFGITVLFARYREYEDFIKWLQAYSRSLTDGEVMEPMTVRVPSRNFEKVGVPDGTMNYGRDRFDVTWKLSIAFQGTRDPLEFDNDAVSKFQMAMLGATATVPYYLPAMSPAEGMTGEQMLYDNSVLRPVRGVF